MRKHYLDNIRTTVILLLFFYHTFMIWNNFGSKYYIWGGNSNIISSLIVLVSPFMMPVLFVVAGISSRYSLEKRSSMEFLSERIRKLFIPFLLGMILLVPFQALFARKFFFSYNGGIIDNFLYFFTHFSDLSGYDGMFTLGHLWFLLYLFVISLVTLFLFRKISFSRVEKKINKINIFEIMVLFLPIFISHYILNFSSKSLGEFTLLYVLGHYLFTDLFIDKILNHKRTILSLFIVGQLSLFVLYFKFSYYGNFLVSFVEWFGILTFIILGKMFLDKENKITEYFRKLSFGIYVLHETLLVIVGYYVLLLIDNIILQIFIIIFLSFILTMLSYKIISKIPILRKILGIR